MNDTGTFDIGLAGHALQRRKITPPGPFGRVRRGSSALKLPRCAPNVNRHRSSAGPPILAQVDFKQRDTVNHGGRPTGNTDGLSFRARDALRRRCGAVSPRRVPRSLLLELLQTRWPHCGRPSSGFWRPIRRCRTTVSTTVTWTAAPCTTWQPTLAIVERMVALYGPDLLLWRTNFFVKNRGSKAIPWHQDFHYWPLEPPVIISRLDCRGSFHQGERQPAGDTRIAPHHRPARRGDPGHAVQGDGRCRLSTIPAT